MSGGGARTMSLIRVIPDFVGDTELAWPAYETDCCFGCRDARVLVEEWPFIVERVLGSAETDS
jgi:hypothetical protein